MAKATGKLIDKGLTRSYHLSSVNKGYAWEGDTVTIELPRNMRVIGTCNTCRSLDEYGCCSITGVAKKLNYKGCGLWKARKK